MSGTLFVADLQQFIGTVFLAAAALLPIVNPLGGAPIYLAKTVDLTPDQHAGLSKSVAVNCFLLLLASALTGAYVLDFFGLSIPVIQVGGGLIVCATAWALLNASDAPAALVNDAANAISPSALSQRAFYPLTLPLTVGPGSISVAITLGANPHQGARDLVVTLLGHATGILIVAVIVYLCYRYADPILRKLGDVGTLVVTKLSAFILLCIGVQIIFNGVRGMLALLPPR